MNGVDVFDLRRQGNEVIFDGSLFVAASAFELPQIGMEWKLVTVKVEVPDGLRLFFDMSSPGGASLVFDSATRFAGGRWFEGGTELLLDLQTGLRYLPIVSEHNNLSIKDLRVEDGGEPIEQDGELPPGCCVKIEVCGAIEIDRMRW